uniref:Uncharacterized protein n=1 Tax=Arundo donax TaxID=35708 RepID=A0A0A9GSN2_ARUDO
MPFRRSMTVIKPCKHISPSPFATIAENICRNSAAPGSTFASSPPSPTSSAMPRSLTMYRTGPPDANSRRSTRSPKMSITRDPAAPLDTASRNSGASSPAAVANATDSPRPTTAPATAIWLAILLLCPLPGGPMWVGFPRWAKSGASQVTTASSPPAKMARVPSRAPTSPPETGASTA